MCYDSVHCAALDAPSPAHRSPPTGAGCVPVGWACSQCYGGHGERETPGPIPNPEAKPLSADGTVLETGWESRTPPDNHSQKGPTPPGAGPFCIPGPFLVAPRQRHTPSAASRLPCRRADVVAEPLVEPRQVPPRLPDAVERRRPVEPVRVLEQTPGVQRTAARQVGTGIVDVVTLRHPDEPVAVDVPARCRQTVDLGTQTRALPVVGDRAGGAGAPG